MRKLSHVIVGAAVAFMAATPAFAFTTYDQSVGQSSASNFSDPDQQLDALAGSGGDEASSSGIVQFGGSAMDASAARAGIAAQNDDKDSSYSGFYIPDN
jgi:hypothetical protein